MDKLYNFSDFLFEADKSSTFPTEAQLKRLPEFKKILEWTSLTRHP